MDAYLTSHAPYIIFGVFFAGVFAIVMATAVADWAAGIFGVKVEDEG